MTLPESCVIIGSSTGLGAAFVDELLHAGAPFVIGIARTKAEKLENRERWGASRRYRHVALDIGLDEAVGVLREIATNFPPAPLLVIYNAACLLQEVNVNHTINYDIFAEVNRVGVNGFGHVLQAFEAHLFQHGGTLAGISSINALRPPVLEPRVAYGATKAYLSMALRGLRCAWPDTINIVTVHLGHIGGKHAGTFYDLLYPSYARTARKLVRRLLYHKIPHEIIYPWPYYITYKYILRFIPDALYFKLLRRVFARKVTPPKL